VFLNCVKVRCAVALRYVSAAYIIQNALRVRYISLEPIGSVSGMGSRTNRHLGYRIIVHIEIDPSCQGLHRVEVVAIKVGVCILRRSMELRNRGDVGIEKVEEWGRTEIARTI
jgi:hypothetical protein